MAAVLSLFVVSLIVPAALAAGDDLVPPPSINSTNGVLDISLDLDMVVVQTAEFTFTTRALGGMVPAPTLRLLPGDTLKITFNNKLTGVGTAHQNNVISAPDESNLHFHGLHISGELPSDDSTYTVLPGDSYNYSTLIPSVHMPGTHWMHPHRHGSTAIQVAGGAAGMLIIDEDPSDSNPLPDQIKNAREIIMVVQQLYFDSLASFYSTSGITLNSTDQTGQYMLVNGQVQPVLRLDVGEWVRLRIVYAGFNGNNLGMTISGDSCEMQLLAKDGVYIRDYPREISEAPIDIGGRADIMLRCNNTNTTYMVNSEEFGGVFMTIQTSNTTITPEWLASFTPTYPDYMADLRNETIPSECSCDTTVGTSGGINDRKFNADYFIHQSVINSTVERVLDSGNHPYHQHVFPFQFYSVDETEYYKIGDWHDVFQGDATVRYNAIRFVTKLMVHCHKLNHEDTGMMGMERVNADGACMCPSVGGIPVSADSKSDTLRVAMLSAASVCAVLALGAGIFFALRGSDGGGGGSRSRHGFEMTAGEPQDDP